MRKIIFFCLALFCTNSIIAQVRCNQGDQDPITDNGKETTDPNPSAKSEAEAVQPVDPNEIVGTDGWMVVDEWGDTVRWVSAEQSLPYTVYFENDPLSATAAAQVVTVRLKLHPLMNIADFRVGTFGFGNRVFPVEGSPLQYQTRLDLTEEMNLYVDVVAGIDITTNEAFWIFSSIDPTTGVAPTESDRGFLAVNDSTHIGEGFVTFSIKPAADRCHTGDTIGVEASIVFDVNDPIETNRWVNTIDAVAPVSHCMLLADNSTAGGTPANHIIFSGEDDATGMAAYRLYYTENGSAFRLAGRYMAGDTAVIEAEPNTRYSFFSLGEDMVGNIEPMKDAPDTLIGNTTVRLLASVQPAGAGTVTGTGSYTFGDTAALAVQPAEGYRFRRWTEGGIPLGTDTLLTLVAEQSHNFTAEMALISYPLTITAAEGTSIAVTVRTAAGEAPAYHSAQHFDTLDIHINTSPCYGSAAFVLNGSPLTSDTTVVVHEVITLTSTATLREITGDTTIVACDSANWYGEKWYAGTLPAAAPTHILTNAAGCDSVVTLNLMINYSNTGVETVTACNSYVWHDTEYSASTNTPTYTGTNISGCDSVVTLNLTIMECSTTEIVACDSYTWHGTTYTTSGTYVDGTDTLVLTVNYSNTSIENVSACDSYTWWNTNYTNSTNEATHTYTNVAGCDSVVTLNLTVNNSNISVENVTACDSYTWWNTNYTNSTNEATHTFTNVAGCDSLVTLNLTINYSNTSVETVTACNRYVWHGTEYSTSTNTPTYTGTNISGCDSVVTLNLTIMECSTTEIVACDNYTWHGTTYTTSGTYVDETDTLLLTVNYSNTGIENVTACDSYTWWNTNYTNSTNEATHTFTNVAGCDSMVTLHLTVNYSNTGIENVTACDSYTWHGTTYTASNNATTYIETNAAGCDSVVTLNLTINYSNTGVETVTACNRYVWHGTEYSTSTNTPTYTSTNISGCDSVVTLNLTIMECSTTEIVACDSYTWHGTTYTTSGTYVDGTDTLVLTVNYSNTGIENVTACDNYTWWNTNYTNSTNEATHTFTNAAGCDSVVTLHLTVNYSNTSVENVTACDSYTWWNTNYTNSTNEATHTFTNVAGCDSVVTLNLTINYSNTGVETVTACDSLVWHGNNYTESTDTAIFITQNAAGCDSTINLHLTINYSIYVFDTLLLSSSQLPYNYHGTEITQPCDLTIGGVTSVGCDSIVYLHVDIHEGINDIDGSINSVRVYPNPTLGSLTIEADGVIKVEVLDIVGRMVAIFDNTNTIDLSNLDSGTYTLRIKTAHGTAVRKVVKK